VLYDYDYEVYRLPSALEDKYEEYYLPLAPDKKCENYHLSPALKDQTPEKNPITCCLKELVLLKFYKIEIASLAFCLIMSFALICVQPETDGQNGNGQVTITFQTVKFRMDQIVLCGVSLLPYFVRDKMYEFVV
jgi:hypothetical protein